MKDFSQSTLSRSESEPLELDDPKRPPFPNLPNLWTRAHLRWTNIESGLTHHVLSREKVARFIIAHYYISWANLNYSSLTSASHIHRHSHANPSVRETMKYPLDQSQLFPEHPEPVNLSAHVPSFP